MQKPPIDLKPEHWLIVAQILAEQVHDKEVWAFGSRAMGTAKEYSDLDLAVIGDEPLGLSLSASLAESFSESLLPFKVDVVDWATTSPTFRELIRRDRVVIQGPSTHEVAADGRDDGVAQ
ncbi:MAG: nucleotidyltransferase domain-containing protein [Fimbriimonas ginsengisoli]|uniref:Nucleotidyltransferase domain-containing protein n=1 Tax=Fimbriimonas ginsengisoli TaxID=1005039 RepID=A0A931LU96_FIMGI|nr:nucleotidyltransferase domain-containing protein [Fimbriimonas ginsengisoli]